ncbi:G-box-binding factor 1-like [Abrus precatorius]|uniref:G-box-binding factor 1-like n=1 Tax=Abrus precatorius TaxID=3816 RepID=A0A8B8LJ49_ABRPR|nr:G-box-binding factor 1-like [Abrus precatorius]
MESEENKRFGEPYINSVPQDETMNLPQPLPPPWSTSRKDYHDFGCTPTSSLNQAGSYFYPSWLANQTWSKPPQYDSLYDHSRLSNYPMAAEVGQGAPLACKDKIHGTFVESNMNSMYTFNKSLQPISEVTEESRKNGKRSLIPQTNWEGLKWSAASESMGTPVNNYCGSTNFSFKLQNFPSTEKQQSSMMPGKGGGAHVTSIENRNAIHENRITASDHLEAILAKLNQNLGTDLNASEANPQLEDKKEHEELSKTVDHLSLKNSLLKKKIHDLSHECEELTNENNSLLEELVEKYGLETIVNLMNTKPT